MKRSYFTGLALAALAGTSLGLSGCSSTTPGSFDQSEPATSHLSNLVSISRVERLFSDDEPEQPLKPVEKIECPQLAVLDGTAVHRVYSGPESSETLKYQYSIGDVARQCIKQGDRIGIKVGVEGKVLLGPTGAPSAFTVPIRIVVLKGEGEKPLVSKLYAASVSFPPGQTVGTFTIVSELLQVAADKDESANDFLIKVGIDASGKGEAPEGRKRKRS